MLLNETKSEILKCKEFKLGPQSYEKSAYIIYSYKMGIIKVIAQKIKILHILTKVKYLLLTF